MRARFVFVFVALATLLGMMALPQVATAETMASTTTAAGGQFSPSAPRERADLNHGWRFILADVVGAEKPGFDDRSWAKVVTPHTWNAADGADGGDDYHRGAGWYRQHYTVPATMAGKQLYLQFAGVNQVADVWVNGVHVGQHVGGYARFRFNATSALRVGQDNVIAVRVDNAHSADIAPLRADYSFQGGIYRNVSLWAVDPLQIRMLDHSGPGVYLRQQHVSKSHAVVDVTAKLWNNHTASRKVTVRTTVTDDAGKVVARHTTKPQSVAGDSELQTMQTVRIERPRLWQGTEDPYLYQAHVELIDTTTGRVTDAVSEPLGLRSVRVDPDKGFFLNGSHVKLKGVNLHQDRAGKGWAIDNADHSEDLAIIAEMGANAIRMAHYQHDQRDYDLADQYGFVVYAEIPFINDYTGSSAFKKNLEQQLVEMIRQNYNHPSIVFWGIGNEQRKSDDGANSLLAGLSDLADREDPDRITSYASCCVSDTSRVTGHAETASYNKYFGWYSASVHDLGKWADRLHAKEPSRAIGLTEYGAGANLTHHTTDRTVPITTGRWHPEEYQAYFHEESWKQLAARDYIWGSFVWNMFDFASDRRAEGDQPGINDKGLVSFDRTTRKDAFYWYKANWADTPTLHITSKRWTDRTDQTRELKVYSNASKVTAYVNGKSIGSRTSADHIFRWPITLKRGDESWITTVRVEAVINGVKHTDTVDWRNSTKGNKIEAEHHDEQTGTRVIDTPNGMAVGFINRGDQLVYKNVSFPMDGTRAVAMRVASDSAKGGKIEMRLDRPDGPLLATVPISNTGGWDNYQKVQVPTQTAVGNSIRDIYLSFTSPSHRGIANIDRFSLIEYPG